MLFFCSFFPSFHFSTLSPPACSWPASVPPLAPFSHLLSLAALSLLLWWPQPLSLTLSAPLCHTLCVWHPQAHLLSQRDAQRHLFSQLFDFCLSLWSLAACSWLASLALVCLSSGPTFLVPQRTSFRAFFWGNTSFMPAHQILSSPWSLSPALLVTGPSCCLVSPFLL